MTQNPINNAASELTIDNLFLDGNTISSTDTNGNVIIAPDGSGEVSVTAAPIVPSSDRAHSLGSATNSWDNVYADGITFDDGTNILDTYTEATSFTPTVAFGGASVGVTYTTQTGSYTRIGNLIWFNISIVLSSKGSSTGSCTIEGLPFTTNAAASYPIRCSSVSFTGGRSYFLGISGGSATNLNVQEVGAGANFLNVQDTAVTNTSQFFLSGIFRTAT